jgi:hypothetical protein
MHRSIVTARTTARVLAGWALLALAPAAHGLPLISEVFYDAVGSDDGYGFVELYGSPGSSLDGLRLEVVNGDNGAIVTGLNLAGVFGVSGLFVIADRTAAGTTEVAGADLLLDFDIQNGPDSVVLRAGATVLDAVGFGVFGPEDVFAGEGAAALDVPAGSSLARRFANLDSDDNASDFIALETPTPGSAVFAPIPEPGVASLCALGLAGLGARRRMG